MFIRENENKDGEVLKSNLQFNVTPDNDDISKTEIEDMLLMELYSQLNNLVVAKCQDSAIQTKEFEKKQGIEWGDITKFENTIKSIIESNEGKSLVVSPTVCSMIERIYGINTIEKEAVSDTWKDIKFGDIKDKNITLYRDIMADSDYVLCLNSYDNTPLIEYTTKINEIKENEELVGFELKYKFSDFDPAVLDCYLYVFM